MKKKSLFKCPVCSKTLTQGEKQYFCSNGHSFDIARKGYVNLMLPNHKGSGDPGDSKEMLESRRDFLNKGYYEKFSDQINEILMAFTENAFDSMSILDAGCGEGYYTWRLKDSLSKTIPCESLDIYGIDVSKPAVHYAAKADNAVRFAVASSYHIPIMSGSIDYILCIFAPRDEEEFSRILKPSGKVIVAAPGPKHLLGLRKAIYGDIDFIGLKGTVGEGFKLLKHINVTYDIHLKSNKDILDLLMMTPYSRHTDQNMLASISGLNELSTEVDFSIRVYQKE